MRHAIIRIVKPQYLPNIIWTTAENTKKITSEHYLLLRQREKLDKMHYTHAEILGKIYLLTKSETSFSVSNAFYFKSCPLMCEGKKKELSMVKNRILHFLMFIYFKIRGINWKLTAKHPNLSLLLLVILYIQPKTGWAQSFIKLKNHQHGNDRMQYEEKHKEWKKRKEKPWTDHQFSLLDFSEGESMLDL